ncbi:NAD(P)H-hydrate epimerase [Qipengyuania sp. CAU 1752]
MRSEAVSNQVLTVAQMQAAEQKLIGAGTSVDDLMRLAGEGAAHWVWRLAAGRPVTVLCGPGNNGGDGYVIAAEIAKRGADVKVVAPIAPATDAAKNSATKYSGSVVQSAGQAKGEVLVDCLFGSGLSRPLSDDLDNLLDGLWVSHRKRIAIDVASGVSADSGEAIAADAEVRPYDMTIALGAWKRAHWSGPSASHCGHRVLVDIGIADQTVQEKVFQRPKIEPPPPDTHKYRRGLVAVVAGEMPGAATLAAMAALGAGAGYVKLFGDASFANLPADLVIDNGLLAESLGDDRIDAVLVGPGLGRSLTARDRVCAVLESGRPAVVDADALMLLGPDLLEGIDTSRIVITPHEGELAALCSSFAVQGANKRAGAEHLAEATGLTVLAKGPDTILCSVHGVGYFPRGSEWLSVAGSGDVLAGIVASRYAAGNGDPAIAAGEAVWLHHEAARQAGVAFSASKLAHRVSSAYATFL